MVSDSQRSQLAIAAKEAARAAYCPYSQFPVGAAVLMGDRIFTGCNVENASYGLTICAERVAIFSAIAAGESRLQAIAIACPQATSGDSAILPFPCGACRQVIAEFATPELTILVDGAGVFQLSDLLPHTFNLSKADSPESSG